MHITKHEIKKHDSLSFTETLKSDTLRRLLKWFRCTVSLILLKYGFQAGLLFTPLLKSASVTEKKAQKLSPGRYF